MQNSYECIWVHPDSARNGPCVRKAATPALWWDALHADLKVTLVYQHPSSLTAHVTFTSATSASPPPCGSDLSWWKLKAVSPSGSAPHLAPLESSHMSARDVFDGCGLTPHAFHQYANHTYHNKQPDSALD